MLRRIIDESFMQYSLLQKTLAIPDVDMFKRVFRHMPGFIEADAHTMANDALGVLVKHQSQEDAMRLQRALRAEGMETELVPDASLIPIPAPKIVKRLECRPESLVIYDALDRPIPMAWPGVLMVAAGGVRSTEFERVEVKREERAVGSSGALGLKPNILSDRSVVSMEARETHHYHMMLEIITGRADARYSVKVDATSIFLFQYLGARRTKNIWDNFTMLVQDLGKYAQNAALNSGAFYIKENSGEIFSYATKVAFMEEMTWLLWQMASRSQKSRR